MGVRDLLRIKEWRYVLARYARRAQEVRTRASVQVPASAVAEVLAVAEEAEGTALVGLFRLRDGRFLTVRAMSGMTDQAPHEVWEEGSAEVSPTLPDALALGLTGAERARLGAQLVMA
jgi:hypothetical protein